MREVFMVVVHLELWCVYFWYVDMRRKVIIGIVVFVKTTFDVHVTIGSLLIL